MNTEKRVFSIRYSSTHTHDINKKEGISSVVKKWSDLVGEKMVGEIKDNVLVITKK